ncbi:MAG TPA: AAA family ATPase, partial [Actinomycetota bacterium]|nr:AAA family ATPase [Actinomycetota bacterium]
MTAIGRAGSGFVGRESELAELEAALGDAVEGRGRLVLISGEPGIGKSRLAAELVRQAQARGIVVLSGRCWEAGGAPPYWPWVQALRPLVRELPAHRLASHLGEGGPDVAQMLPEIRSALPDLAEPPSLDSDAARFQLFDSTAQFLLRAARDEPMVLVLDDLHSADVPSLLLLRFVAPELSRAHVLVVATWRTGEMGIEHPLAEAVADVLRLPATRRLELAGFSERDVAAFVESTAGVTPSPQQVAAIRGETEGNPLFVQEVVRLLASEGMLEQVGRGTSLPAIPQGVREVIGRRLLHISDECTRVLTLAAVLGREFTLEALRRMSELAADDLLEVLEEAVSARVVEDVPGSLGWLRFSHVLIRDVLYEDVSGTQRLRLHRRAGTVLEELYRADPTPHLAELAHHFAQAAPAGEWAKAVEYARRAGDQAVDQLAYEEAVRVYGIALQALDLEPSAEEETRCDLLLALGDAQARAGGLGARETFVAAADLAQRLGRPQALAKAALGYGGRFTWSRAAGDARIVPLLEAARAALGERDDPLLVQVLGRLSCALRDRHEREPRWTLSRLAVAM